MKSSRLRTTGSVITSSRPESERGEAERVAHHSGFSSTLSNRPRQSDSFICGSEDAEIQWPGYLTSLMKSQARFCKDSSANKCLCSTQYYATSFNKVHKVQSHPPPTPSQSRGHNVLRPSDPAGGVKTHRGAGARW